MFWASILPSLLVSFGRGLYTWTLLLGRVGGYLIGGGGLIDNESL